MNRKHDDTNKWRIVPDERYYRLVKTFLVKVPKSEWNAHPGCYSVGSRMPLRRVFDLNNKNAIRIDSDYCSTLRITDVPQDIADCLAPGMDKGTLYSGWISAADSSDNTVQIDIYERLQLPCTGLTNIHWYAGGCMGPFDSVLISSRDRSFHYSVDDFSQSITNPTVLDISFRFSPEQWEHFVQPAFLKCNFTAWADKDEYYNPHIYDGQQWKMVIRQGRKQVKRISGSNDYPEEWGHFLRFVSACLELYKPEGDYHAFYGSLLRYPLSIECSEFRREYDMSQKELAVILGVRARDISKWEKSLSKPDGLTLMKLYEIIDMASRYVVHAAFDGDDNGT